MKEYRNLTIFFVSFFSSQFIEKILKKYELQNKYSNN